MLTDPRLFADLDNDGDIDIVGVDVNGGVATVRYGLNNGIGFDAPVDWITGLAWNNQRDDALLADVDNNGFPDFIHARFSDHSIVAYTTNGASLVTTAQAPQSFDIADPTLYPDRRFYPHRLIDLDGNGCADLVLFAHDATYYRPSLCNGQFGASAVANGDFDWNSAWRVPFQKRWVDDIVTVKVFASQELPTEVALMKRDVDDLLRDLRSAGRGQVRIIERDPTDDEER